MSLKVLRGCLTFRLWVGGEFNNPICYGGISTSGLQGQGRSEVSRFQPAS